MHRKGVLLILDGLGDLPVSILDGQTPLEAADTPVMDRLAGSGLYGLVDPIGPGKIPSTYPSPVSLPMQALIGGELSNLCILEVK